MNATDPIKPATQPINLAHEVLLKADDAMCAQQIAAEINGHPRPTKAQIKATEKMLKEIHACGMLSSQPGRGGVALYSLTTPICANSQTAAAIGDSEGGETDAPAASASIHKYGHGLSCGACHDGCAGEQCKVERDSPPIDTQREEFTLLSLLADIRAAAGDPDGRLMQDELVQHIAGVVKERDDLRERLDAQIRQWQAFAGRLNTELATALRSREDLHEQSNAIDVTAAAVGYLVRVPKRAPLLRRNPESARSAALSAVRAGAARAEVLAVVPVGTARRGAEWQSTEAGG